jgi:hypothetical protein
MNLLIEIYPENENIQTFSGISKATNNPFTIYKQKAYLHTKSSRFPLEFEINLEQNQPPYKAGMYSITPDSIYINKYKSLAFGQVQLQAVDADSEKKLKTA